MFTIDLRKGAGLPPKSRPILVGLAIVPFLIPLLGLFAAGVCWQQNNTLIQTQQRVIHDNQQKIRGLEDDLSQYRKADEQTNLCYQKLNSVDEALKFRIQATPILVEVIGNLPEFLTITKLNLDRTDRQITEVAEKTGAAKSSLVVQRKLQMIISGPATDTTDIAVRQYVQNLSHSSKLSRWINTVQVTSRNNESVNERNYSLYQIECAMKEQI
jgi:septation ring formation regulator EzrA